LRENERTEVAPRQATALEQAGGRSIAVTDAVRSIRAEHAQLRDRLDLLKLEIAAHSQGRRAEDGLLDLLARFFASFPDEIHHRKEGRLYYALIRKGVAETAFLRRLKDEHAQMEAAARRFAGDLRKLAARRGSATPTLLRRIEGYISALELHMADEESQFLPLVESTLSRERLAEIEAEIDRELSAAAARTAQRKLAAIDAEIGARLTERSADRMGSASL
jgi:hemerythrin-like domain-containing protein